MSVEEDIDTVETELKELLTETLEENGLLAKIRAQLRAGLYIALENEISESNKQSHVDSSLKSNLAKADIRTVFCLVREFLEYFELDFTNSVFEKESFMGILYDYKGKERLIKDLEIGVENVTQTPLLVEVLNIARNTYKFNNKINETVQNMSYINDSKDVINSTYDVPSKNNNSCIDELDSFKNESVSKSSSKNIDIKTVPKTTSQSNDSTSSVDSENSNIQNISTTPNVNSQNTGKDQKNIEPQKLETDDTYEGTSSIAEDSITSNKETPLIDFDKTGKIVSSTTNSPTTSVKCLIDQTLDESPPNKSPRLHSESSSEKKKHDKSKPMSGLSSLADLPPLPVTKARSPDTVLLPSLYSKEFRDRSNLKEIDKLLDLNFDSIDNYEEDFILTDGIDYERNKNINSVLSKNDHNKDSKHFAPVKLFENERKMIDAKKNIEKSSTSTSEKEIDANSNPNISSSNKKDGETTSISEELDLNSNSDDLLKSDNT